MAHLTYHGVLPGPGTLFNGGKFFLRGRVPMADRLIEQVKQNGGEITHSIHDANFIIADHFFPKRAKEGDYSYQYIVECINRGASVNPSDHLIVPASSITSRQSTSHRSQSTPHRRKPESSRYTNKTSRTTFSREDDDFLVEQVELARAQGGHLRGNVLYKEIERLNDRHTYQSWRDRALKLNIANPCSQRSSPTPRPISERPSRQYQLMPGRNRAASNLKNRRTAQFESAATSSSGRRDPHGFADLRGAGDMPAFKVRVPPRPNISTSSSSSPGPLSVTPPPTGGITTNTHATVCGTVIELHLLWTLVNEKYGGHERVELEDLWRIVAVGLGLDRYDEGPSQLRRLYREALLGTDLADKPARLGKTPETGEEWLKIDDESNNARESQFESSCALFISTCHAQDIGPVHDIYGTPIDIRRVWDIVNELIGDASNEDFWGLMAKMLSFPDAVREEVGKELEVVFANVLLQVREHTTGSSTIAIGMAHAEGTDQMSTQQTVRTINEEEDFTLSEDEFLEGEFDGILECVNAACATGEDEGVPMFAFRSLAETTGRHSAEAWFHRFQTHIKPAVERKRDLVDTSAETATYAVTNDDYDHDLEQQRIAQQPNHIPQQAANCHGRPLSGYHERSEFGPAVDPFSTEGLSAMAPPDHPPLDRPRDVSDQVDVCGMRISLEFTRSLITGQFGGIEQAERRNAWRNVVIELGINIYKCPQAPQVLRALLNINIDPDHAGSWSVIPHPTGSPFQKGLQAETVTQDAEMALRSTLITKKVDLKHAPAATAREQIDQGDSDPQVRISDIAAKNQGGSILRSGLADWDGTADADCNEACSEATQNHRILPEVSVATTNVVPSLVGVGDDASLSEIGPCRKSDIAGDLSMAEKKMLGKFVVFSKESLGIDITSTGVTICHRWCGFTELQLVVHELGRAPTIDKMELWGQVAARMGHPQSSHCDAIGDKLRSCYMEFLAEFDEFCDEVKTVKARMAQARDL